jgi:hypothetical protein
MGALGDLPLDEGREMIEAAEGGGDHPALRARIGPVKTGEEAAAGVKVGGDIWRWLQHRGGVQPLEQARFEILEHSDLANILPRRKLKRTAYLLQALDKLLAIKGHSSPYSPLQSLFTTSFGQRARKKR